ncbi:hypothetical protein NEHOM01_1688 [Nematocida homosporus]|uniref:uncharacterized protein n=1 Tax=Nematocida homosporus TaxID=1912981 RepID=UPI00221FBFB2|nr:uncharacterized protein NEHOM01_1688 [Nematocida homosporus]KAI5186757.1 hypothetical protein NEHOM01_1688 [Nematocida homosporus]
MSDETNRRRILAKDSPTEEVEQIIRGADLVRDVNIDVLVQNISDATLEQIAQADLSLYGIIQDILSHRHQRTIETMEAQIGQEELARVLQSPKTNREIYLVLRKIEETQISLADTLSVGATIRKYAPKKIETGLIKWFKKMDMEESERCIMSYLEKSPKETGWILPVYLSERTWRVGPAWTKAQKIVKNLASHNQTEELVSLVKPFYIYSTDELETEIANALGSSAAEVLKECQANIWK